MRYVRAMYNPNISDSDSETDSGSGSGSESDDSQMNAITQWQNAARKLITPPTLSMFPPLEETVISTPEPVGTHTGMYNTHIAFEERRSTHVVMVNSLDRDQSVYPLPTQVRLKLPRVYKNVERIDIVQVKFFCGLYAVSAARKNNAILVNVSGTDYPVSIPDGSYSLTQLLGALQTALNATATLTYTVGFNSMTGRVTISASGPFSLLFQTALPAYNQAAYSEWGLGWNLGWGGQAVDLTGFTSYTADHFPRLGDDYIYLQMNDTEHMNEIDHTDIEVTGRAQDSTGQVSHYFGKLLLNSFGCWAQTFVEAPKTFKPVLGRLERLQFTWTDRHGQLLAGPDAASCDWHMALRITEIVEAATAESTLAQSADRPVP